MTANTVGAVSRSIFSVDACPPGERFEYWRHSIAAIFDVEAAHDVVGDFQATIDSHLLGPLMLARTCTKRQRWIRSSRTVARDSMDHYMVQLYESGGQSTRFDGESGAMHAGQLIVCDLQRTMDNATTDLQNLSILVPRPLLEPRLEHPDAVHGLIIDGTAPPGQILRDHLIALKESACELSAAEVPETDIPETEIPGTEIQEMAEVTVSLIATCLNGVGRAARDKPVAPLLPLSARIKRYIARNLHDAMLTPETIADRQGVSRAALHALFESEGGVFTYIRVMRLKAAFDALRDPHQASLTIQDIARKAGYDSDAFFCRAFKSMFDVTPGELRSAAEMAAPKFAPQPGVDRRYEEWLHSLCPSTAWRRQVAAAACGIPGR